MTAAVDGRQRAALPVRRRADAGAGRRRPYAGHNYLLNVGSGYSVVQNPPAGDDRPNGILYENSAVRIAAIPDGTSQTVAISETIRSTVGCAHRVQRPDDLRAGPARRLRDHREQHRRQRPADHLGRRLRDAAA